MAMETLQEGYDDEQIRRELIKITEFANEGHHPVGNVALMDVGRGVITAESPVFAAGRAVLPTGRLAVSRSMPQFGPWVANQTSTRPGSDNYLG